MQVTSTCDNCDGLGVFPDVRAEDKRCSECEGKGFVPRFSLATDAELSGIINRANREAKALRGTLNGKIAEGTLAGAVAEQERRGILTTHDENCDMDEDCSCR